MSDYLSDKEQAEMLKNWWNNYGRSIAIAVVIGLLIGFGWRYWNQHKIEREQKASAYYQAMLLADESNDSTAAQQQAEILWKQFPGSLYATMAALFTAKEAVANNNLDLALEKLNWAIAHTNNNTFREIAKVRVSRILASQKKYDDALAILQVVDDKTFVAVVAETKGDIYSAQGRTAEAQKEYSEAKQAYTEVGIDNPFLQMKMAG